MTRRYLALFLFLSVFVIVSCQSTSPSRPTTTTAEPPVKRDPNEAVVSDAAIRQGDALTIRISGITPEITQTSEVNEFGMITLPYINEIKAEGLTPGVLAKKIERAYIDGSYYTKLSVSIIPGPRDLYVHGEVRLPGRVVWTPGLTIVKAISLAGGFTDYAKRNDIEIRRRDKLIKVNYKDAENDSNKDVEVYPRDDIKVERTIF